MAAADELARGSLEAAERYLAAGRAGGGIGAGGRRGQAQVLLGVVRLLLAGGAATSRRVAEQARRLQAWPRPGGGAA